jgi:hypothetical protein
LPNIDAARTCAQEPRDLRLLIIGPEIQMQPVLGLPNRAQPAVGSTDGGRERCGGRAVLPHKIAWSATEG